MPRRKVSILVAVLVIAGLLSGCAPAATPAAAPRASAPAPAGGVTPTSAPAITVTPVSSSGSARYGGVVRQTMGVEPPSLDPHEETTSAAHIPTMPAYSGLIQYDQMEDDKIVPDLAASWELSKDNLTYTFNLRQGVKWHDGKPSTSEDAKFSLLRIWQPPKGLVGPRKDVFAAIESIEATDASTLKLVLKRPTASFMANLAVGYNVMMPKHIAEPIGGKKMQQVVGTGPFRFKWYERGIGWELNKNPDYYVKGRPYLDGVKGYIIADSWTRYSALRVGNIDMTMPAQGLLTATQAKWLEENMAGQITVQRKPEPTAFVILFNMRRAPWNDIRVRKALDLAIDRQATVKVAMADEADVSWVTLPWGKWTIPQAEIMKLPGYRQPKDADITEAKRLLAEAGFPNGFTTEFVVRKKSDHESCAVAWKAQLAKIGVEVNLNVLESTTYYDRLDRREFGIAGLAYGGALDDPDELFGGHYITNAPRNYAGYSEPRLDEQYVQQSQSMDLAERRKTVLDMATTVFDAKPRIWVLSRRNIIGVSKKVMDYKMTFSNFDHLKFQDVWVAP